MIYQTDSQFPATIYHWGCYLLSLIERLTTRFDIPFTHDFVLTTLAFGQMIKAIDSEITIVDPQAVCNHVLGAVDKVRFEGKFPANYETLDDELEIVCYHKDGASFNHFCSGNGRGIVVYDPWNATGSDSVRNGSLIGKRIYRIL
jgi:hypothetical protein